MNKETICTTIGAIGSFIAWALGGWTTGLQTLIIFMSIDFIMGLTNAAVFKNSPKTESGALQSATGWKGLCRKGTILLFVLIGHRLDLVLSLDYIKNAVIIGFLTNELISIVENAGLMGIKLPVVITNAIDILNEKSNIGDNK